MEYQYSVTKCNVSAKEYDMSAAVSLLLLL